MVSCGIYVNFFKLDSDDWLIVVCVPYDIFEYIWSFSSYRELIKIPALTVAPLLE